MKKTMWAYQNLGYQIVLGHDDNKFDGETYGAKIFTTGEGLGKQLGEHRQILIGSKMLLEMGCEYIFKTCADIFVAKPFEIPQLVHKLGGYQFLCNQWDVHKDYFGTAIFFGKTELLVEVAEEVEKKLDESKDHKEVIQQSGHKYKIWSRDCIEVVYGQTMCRLGYKYKVMDDIDQEDCERLWRDGLGCEHLR